MDIEQAKREFADKHSSSYRQMMAIEADLNALLEKHKEVITADMYPTISDNMQPTAYEWHNLKTGHCYVDYVPHLDAKEGYMKTPLYSPHILQRAVNEVIQDLATYMKFNLWTGENCQYYPETNEWMYFESPMTQLYFKGTEELFDYWLKNVKK